jgi:hypothetical protein
MVRVSDLCRNWNYAATESEEYQRLLAQIDEFIATKGQEEAETVMAAENGNGKLAVAS